MTVLYHQVAAFYEFIVILVWKGLVFAYTEIRAVTDRDVSWGGKATLGQIKTK